MFFLSFGKYKKHVIHNFSTSYLNFIVKNVSIKAFSKKKTLGMVSYGLGDGDLIFNCFYSKLQPLLYLVYESLKKPKKRSISRTHGLRKMFTRSIIFELLGDGDPSVTFPSKLEGFFMPRYSKQLP